MSQQVLYTALRKPQEKGQPLPRGFSPFLIGAFLSSVGSWMQLVAQGWLVAELSPEPFLTGLIGFCGGIPLLLFSLPGGVLSDRMNRRWLLLFTQIVLMAVAIILALLTAFKSIGIWHVTVLTFFSGLATAITGPAYNGFLFDMVGDRSVRRAVSLNATQYHLSRMVGPVAAGFCLSLVGAWGCFTINAVSFLAVIPFILLIPTAVNQEFEHTKRSSISHNLTEAMRYVLGHRQIALSLVVLVLGSVLLMPHVTLLPLFVKEYLHLRAQDLGWMWFSSGLGSVAATIVNGRLSRFVEKRFNLLLLLGVLGSIALAGLASSNHWGTIHLFLFLIGFSLTSMIVESQTIIQYEVSPALRGRVLGISGTLFQGMFPIGNIFVGILAQLTSIPSAWYIASVILFVLVLGIWPRLKI